MNYDCDIILILDSDECDIFIDYDCEYNEFDFIDNIFTDNIFNMNKHNNIFTNESDSNNSDNSINNESYCDP